MKWRNPTNQAPLFNLIALGCLWATTVMAAAGPPAKVILTLPGQTFISGSGNIGGATPQVAGAAFNITLRLVDASNNTCASTVTNNISYSGPSSADGTPTYVTSVIFTNGVSTNLSTTLTTPQGTTFTAADTTSNLPGAANYLIVVPSGGGTQTKANNTNNVDTGGSWVSGATPANNTVAVFNGVYQTNGNLSYTTNDPVWYGLQLVNPGVNPVVIMETNTTGDYWIRVLGGGIDMSAATANLVIEAGNDIEWGNATYTNIPVNVATGYTCTLLGKLWPYNNSETVFTNTLEITKLGGGTLAIGTDEDGTTGGYAWGTNGFLEISQGTVEVLSNDTAFAGANHSGAAATIILNGGTLRFNVDSSNFTPLAYPFVLGSNSNAIDTETNTVKLNSVITDYTDSPGGFTKIGTGTLVLGATNVYSGGTAISAGTLQLGAANALPGDTIAGDVTDNGTLDLNTYSDMINGLNGSGTVDTVAGGTPTLTVGANGDSGMFSGVIQNSGGTLALTKSGGGTETLSGANTYSGATTISAGTLALSGNGSLASANVMIAEGATFDVSALSSYTLGSGTTLSASGEGATVGSRAATIQGASGGTINLGSQPIVLTYDGSDPALYVSQGVLSLNGNAFTVNSTAPLAAGNYIIIEQASGNISGGGYYTISGTAIGNGLTPSISVTNGFVILTLTSPHVFSWPANQLLPTFATPANVLDCIDMTTNSDSEKDLFVSLEGIVNRTQPRIACVDGTVATEGKFTWLQLCNLSTNMMTGYSAIQKYLTNVTGLVVPDPNQPDTLNLATTIAGIKNELICATNELNTLTNAPYNLQIHDDLRGRFTNNYQVYEYLYSNYWPQCTHRLIAGLDTSEHGELRDYCVALDVAPMWLDPGPSNATDQAVMGLFLTNMTPANGVYIGWTPNEIDLLDWIGQYGIPVMASDLFENATVFSGVPSRINIPAAPPTPPLQNKVYVAMMMSDGDNVQYMQHYMKTNWANPGRGRVPIGWTVQPLLVDFFPAMLDYYWSTASSNDWLIAGPSGAGYTRVNYWSLSNVEAFAQASNPYLQNGGLQVITVLNSVSNGVGQAFATNCPSLLGLTGNVGSTYTAVTLGLRTVGLTVADGDDTNVLYSAITNAAATWNGRFPLFIAAVQLAWSNTPAMLQNLAASLNTNEYVFVRPNDFFTLYNEANPPQQQITQDCYVEQSQADSSFINAQLYVSGNSGNLVYSYLQVTIPTNAMPSAPAQVYLYLNANNAITDTEVYQVTNNSWNATNVTWNNKPASGALITSMENIGTGTYCAFDVSSYVTGPGTYSFCIQTTNTASLNYNSSRSTMFTPYLQWYVAMAGTNSIGSILSGNPTTVTAYGAPGYSYVTQRATNLAPAVWMDISTNVATANGVITVMDFFSDLGNQPPAAAYYRLSWSP